MYFLSKALLLGLGATAFLDVWTYSQKRLFSAPVTNWCFVGRWAGHLREGQFVHPNIAQTPAIKGECLIGWLAHYGIGIVFALALLLLAADPWLRQPTLLPALAFGLVTVVFPYFILQPALGAGIAASRTPNPNKARLRSLITHGVFGVGLYASAMLLSAAGFFA